MYQERPLENLIFHVSVLYSLQYLFKFLGSHIAAQLTMPEADCTDRSKVTTVTKDPHGAMTSHRWVESLFEQFVNNPNQRWQ